MTTTIGRRTIRETTALVRNRGRAKPVIVNLVSDQIELRLKGERRRVRIPVSTVYTMALHAWVQAEKARRKAERKAKRA